MAYPLLKYYIIVFIIVLQKLGGDFMKILVVNGPNLNMLGIREPGIYGNDTYEDLCAYIDKYCAERKITVEHFQSNHEGCIVDRIQEAFGKVDGMVINPAAYTHTSVAILDAIKACNIPTVEVHISDIDEREEFRKISYVSSACIATIKGEGLRGYTMAIDVLIDELK